MTRAGNVEAPVIGAPDFIALLDSAPRPNGAPVPVARAAQGDMRQRAIEAMQEARAAWRQAQRRAREAARVTVEWADEDVA